MLVPNNDITFTLTGKEKDPLRLYLQSGELCRARLTSPPDLLTGYSYLPHQARQAHHGARYLEHDLMTGWLSVDPMADKYPSLSPYAYCAWNPVRLIDPDGCEIGDYYDIKGNYLGWDGKNDNYEMSSPVADKIIGQQSIRTQREIKILIQNLR